MFWYTLMIYQLIITNLLFVSELFKLLSYDEQEFPYRLWLLVLCCTTIAKLNRKVDDATDRRLNISPDTKLCERSAYHFTFSLYFVIHTLKNLCHDDKILSWSSKCIISLDRVLVNQLAINENILCTKRENVFRSNKNAKKKTFDWIINDLFS